MTETERKMRIVFSIVDGFEEVEDVPPKPFPKGPQLVPVFGEREVVRHSLIDGSAETEIQRYVIGFAPLEEQESHD